MSDSGPFRIFVVDDHELVRQALHNAIDAEDDMEWAGEASTAEEARDRFPSLAADVALLDVRLPDGDGIELCREFRAMDEDLRCLMLTSFSGDEAVYRSILAGADGYLLKGVQVGALMQALRRVGRGGSLLDPTVTAGVLARLRSSQEDDNDLTPQEARVLEGIVDGLSNKEIGERLGLAQQTVKNYVSNVLSKLGVSTRTQAAVYGARRRTSD